MANQNTGTVRTLTTTEIKGKDGKSYTAVQLTLDTGDSFNGYDNQLPKGLKEGDKISVLSSQGSKKDGTTFNKIISTTEGGNTGFSGGGHSQSTTNFQLKETGTTTQGKTFIKSENKYDSKGARIGMIIKAGCDLALGIAKMNKTNTVTSTDLASATDLVRKEVNRVEKLEA